MTMLRRQFTETSVGSAAKEPLLHKRSGWPPSQFGRGGGKRINTFAGNRTPIPQPVFRHFTDSPVSVFLDHYGSLNFITFLTKARVT
jgi:hypothetical protein